MLHPDQTEKTFPTPVKDVQTTTNHSNDPKQCEHCGKPSSIEHPTCCAVAMREWETSNSDGFC